MTDFFASSALLPDGWRHDVRITVSPRGAIERVEANAAPDGADRLSGPIVPGIPNAHSHAFQRAMAGTAERRTGANDSFWTWRTQMYRMALSVSPEELQAVAAQLFVELLKGGYTSVAEFHYLHHDLDGSAYADPAELSRRVLAAAAEAGIRLTLLPVIYAYAGFGERPLEAEQRRFRSEPDFIFDLIDRLRPAVAENPLFATGIAPHSLRAVSAPMLRAVAGAAPGMIHIHIAEQQPEVEAALATTGKRPIQLLADTIALDPHWCLVHATHALPQELEAIAGSGAVVALCPTTEGNLGDGFFDLHGFRERHGRISIGSDSNICPDAAEELRLLEYGQRLLSQRRCIVGPGSTGRALFDAVLAGGAQAIGQEVGRIEAGCQADWLVLDDRAGAIPGQTGDALLDQLVFAPRGAMVRDVMVAGRWVVRDGLHKHELAIRRRSDAALARLWAER